MKTTTYHAGPGAPFPEARAQEIGEYIASLGDEITPGQLLSLAQDKKCPLHDLFEWDDSKAARRYRLDQARMILGKIEVDVVIKDRDPIRERAFISLKVMKADEDKANNQGHRHIPLERIRLEPDLAMKHRAQLERDLNNMKARYEAFGHVFDAAFAALATS